MKQSLISTYHFGILSKSDSIAPVIVNKAGIQDTFLPTESLNLRGNSSFMHRTRPTSRLETVVELLTDRVSQHSGAPAHKHLTQLFFHLQKHKQNDTLGKTYLTIIVEYFCGMVFQ